jgi:hypothetical protein
MATVEITGQTPPASLVFPTISESSITLLKSHPVYVSTVQTPDAGLQSAHIPSPSNPVPVNVHALTLHSPAGAMALRHHGARCDYIRVSLMLGVMIPCVRPRPAAVIPLTPLRWCDPRPLHAPPVCRLQLDTSTMLAELQPSNVYSALSSALQTYLH